MTHWTVQSSLIHVVLAAITVCVSLHGEAAPRSAVQSGKRAVRMEITVPKDIPPLQITSREGEIAELEVADVGKFGFEPTFQKGDNSVVIVTIFDLATSPRKRLAQVEVPADGKQQVQSKTSPAFGIRIVSITAAK
jgi:hypothetical protein